MQSVEQYLQEQYPDARPGFILMVTRLLELHANKNHDYNGKNQEDIISEFETAAKFADVRRKFSRLYHAIAEKNDLKVNESMRETSIDLAVYAILFAEYMAHAENYYEDYPQTKSQVG